MDETTDSKREPGADSSPFPDAVRWRAVLEDVLLVSAWVALVSVGWGVVRWPTWAYYVVVFGGILGYSLASDPWNHAVGDGE